MKLGILFSGGKDSTYAAFLAKRTETIDISGAPKTEGFRAKEGYELTCLITIISENPDSYMFQQVSQEDIQKQADAMNLPVVYQKTKGIKEKELKDLEKAIKKAKEELGIEGLVIGALASVYQASRVQEICDNLELWCFNPLWQKDQFELLDELLKEKFKIKIVKVAAEGLDESWVGKIIDKKFLQEIRKLNEKFKVNPAGEGGEFETYVLNCPLFKREIK